MPVMHRAAGFATLLMIAALLTAAPAEAQTYPARIGERAFILDEAGMLDSADVEAIRTLCDALLTERKIPIVVVTIPSLAHYGAADWSIERYTHNLFDEWGIGYPDHNYGVLLLIAEADRK